MEQRPTPLALYLFTQDRTLARRVMRDVAFGGGCVNDTIMHLATSHMGFGGMGNSGMGSYHGVEGFRSFSHARAVYSQPKIDLAKIAGLKPPYGAATVRTLKMQLK